MKSKSKWLALVATLAVVFVLVLSLGLSSIFASADGTESYDRVRYYSDFNSSEEAHAAAEETNLSLAEEGIVLLKNDGVLPLAKGSKVSVLGIAQDCLMETAGSISESLSDAGLKVNPTLESKYLNDEYVNGGVSDTTYGNETELNGVEKSSLKTYSDAAIVVISRGEEGEGATNNKSMNTGEIEDNEYLGQFQGWQHEALFGSEDVEYKHSLELTASENELIKTAEECCDNVIVLYSAPSTFEMANLEDDDNINGIAYIGQMGDGGIGAVGEILVGDVTPSGKVADEWNRDFTNDPTYANAFNYYMSTSSSSYDYPYEDSVEEGARRSNKYVYSYTDSQGNLIDVVREGHSGGFLAGMSNSTAQGIDYEEDIYLGYKYYETYWAEASKGGSTLNPSIKGQQSSTAGEWYSYNVVYPFGYGMSYADFSYNLLGVKTNAGGSLMEVNTTKASISTADLSSSKESGSANVSDITVSVEVTNESKAFSGKEVVEIYMEAPYYEGGTEKAYVSLVGFGKTKELRPGQSETLDITFAVQDFASYDYADMNDDGHTGYELDEGDYTIHIMESSSHLNMDKDNPAYASCTFQVGSDVTPTSGDDNVSAAHLDLDDYSGNEIENLFSGSDNDEQTDDDWKDDYYSMVLAEESGSMISPLAVKADQTNQTVSTMLSRSDMDVKPTAPTGNRQLSAHGSTEALTKFTYIDTTDPDVDSGQIWEKTIADIPSDWSQATGVADATTGLYPIVLDDMSGVPFDDPQWTTFMNQLTWDEIATILYDGYHETRAIPTIGKLDTYEINGPNTSNQDVYWACEPTVASTWNTDLCYSYGRVAGNIAMYNGMSGWYAPGMNIHRNQFAGRTAEYYSQDGMQSAYIACAVVQGASDMGICTYVKHFALYDGAAQYQSTYVQISEQNFRENYLKPFRMCMEQGGARSAMTAISSIGAVVSSQNYVLITKLAREEWDWNGFTVTDMASGLPGDNIDGLVRAGAEFPDGYAEYSANMTFLGELSGYWNPDYVWTDDNGQAIEGAPTGAVMLSTSVTTTTGEEGSEVTTTVTGEYASPTQWYCARMSAQRILYNQANSVANRNGIISTSESVTLDLTQGASASATLLDLSDGEYAGHIVTSSYVSGGSLADGMVLDGNTLSGTPTSTEGGSAVITVYVDGWIPIEVAVTFSVTPVVSIGGTADISSVSTGASVNAYVVPDTSLGLTSYSVTVCDGALPQGLSLNEATGQISGTPEKAGVYEFTLALTTDGGDTYYMPYTITVTGDDYSSSVSSEDLDAAVQEAVDAAIAGTGSSGAAGSESSSGNGMAIAGLVIGIVAVVGVVALLVVILMPKGKKKDD